MRLALALLASLTAGGCYDPSVSSCSVTCSSSEQCAGNQTCNAKGLCVSDGEACNSETPVDAPQTSLALHVTVMGKGRIDVTNGGQCASDCTYMLPANTQVTATWVVTMQGHDFMNWTTPNCLTAGQTCTFTLNALTKTVGAKFK